MKYKRQMTGNKLRCAGLHNLLPVIWRLYFNKLTKKNIQFLIKHADWYMGNTKEKKYAFYYHT